MSWALKTLADGTVYPLELGTIVRIGRGKTATLQLDHQTLARLHCELVVCIDDVKLTDLGSPSGSLVNHQRRGPGFAMREGDVLQIGTLTLQLIRH